MPDNKTPQTEAATYVAIKVETANEAKAYIHACYENGQGAVDPKDFASEESYLNAAHQSGLETVQTALDLYFPHAVEAFEWASK